MSSLLSIIGLTELTRKAKKLTATVDRPLEIYTALVVAYYEMLYSVGVKSLNRFHSFQKGGVTV